MQDAAGTQHCCHLTFSDSVAWRCVEQASRRRGSDAISPSMQGLDHGRRHGRILGLCLDIDFTATGSSWIRISDHPSDGALPP